MVNTNQKQLMGGKVLFGYKQITVIEESQSRNLKQECKAEIMERYCLQATFLYLACSAAFFYTA